jgi:protein TonB
MPSNFHHPIFLHARHAGAGLLRFWQQGERLTHLHFAAAVFLAFLLHATAYGVWQLMPREAIMDIPVKVLNIKLGDGDDMPTEEQQAPKIAPNNAVVEQIISKVAKDMQAEAPAGEVAVQPVDKPSAAPAKKPVDMEKLMAKAKPFDVRTEGTAVAAPVQSVVASQFVREQDAPPTQGGSTLGNSNAPSAEAVARYEQLISAWIDKFKPEKLMVVGQPARATASVRIRIDRRGNIRFMELEQSSQFQALDRAAIDTVRRANPVPPAPADYPSAETIEFIVPIVFTQ